MSAKVLEWACPACGEDGVGEMPPEHEAHRAPGPRELIVIVHPSTGWGITMCPIECLSPMQGRGLFFDRERGWWCAPLP